MYGLEERKKPMRQGHRSLAHWLNITFMTVECVDDGWLKQPHLASVEMIGLWGWGRPHTCFTLSNQCATGSTSNHHTHSGRLLLRLRLHDDGLNRKRRSGVASLLFIPRSDKRFREEFCVHTVTQKCVEFYWVCMSGV